MFIYNGNLSVADFKDLHICISRNKNFSGITVLIKITIDFVPFVLDTFNDKCTWRL